MATLRSTATNTPASATSMVVSLPAGWQAGDLVLVYVGWKYRTGDCSIDSGFTDITGRIQNSTSGTGTDVGGTAGKIFGKVMEAGDTAPTVTATATINSWNAISQAWTPDAGKSWTDAADLTLIPFISIDDTTGGFSPLTGSGTFTSQPDASQGDTLIAFGTIPTDAGTALGTCTFTGTGLSGGTVSNSNYVENALGGDVASGSIRWQGFTGTATDTMNILLTFTSATNTNGMISILWLRESAPSGTPIGKDLQMVWNAYQAVGKSNQLLWNTFAPVGKSTQLVWNVRTPIGKDLQLKWNVAQAVGKALQLIWNVVGPIGKDLALVWNTRATVNKDLQLKWNVRTPIGKDLQLKWNVRSLVAKSVQFVWNTAVKVNKDLQFVWNVLIGATAVGKDLVLVWNTKAVVGKNISYVWNTKSKVNKDLQLKWNVYQPAPVGKNLQLVWKVRQAIGKDLQLKWDVFYTFTWVPVPKDVETWNPIAFSGGIWTPLPADSESYTVVPPAATVWS